MPIKLSALSADRRTIKVPFGDGHLTITYKPSAVNAVQEERELADRAEGKQLLSQARSIAETLVSWDLVDDADKPVPVSVDVIAEFALDVSNKLYNAILDDLVPNRRRRPNSPSGSSAEESSAPAPSGTRTS